MKALFLCLLVAVMAQAQTLQAQCPNQRLIVPSGNLLVMEDGYVGSGTLAQIDVTVNGQVYRIPCLCVQTRTSTVIEVHQDDLVNERNERVEFRKTPDGYYWVSSGNVGLAEVEYNPY